MKKKVPLLLSFIFFIILLLPAAVGAEENFAADITASTEYSGTGYSDFSFLHDGNIKKFVTSNGKASVTLSNPEGIGNLYLIFDLEYGEYTLKNNDTGNTVTVGKNCFLHDYLNLTKLFGGAVKSVTVEFSRGEVRLSEIKAYTRGEAPEGVQVWEEPLEGKTDILLFSTHGDDDQLFFAGLLPTYAGERGLGVQVVYLTDHRNMTKVRTHEILNGLWATGVRAYPVMGAYSDIWAESLEDTYRLYEKEGTTKEELRRFVTEQIRRFKPQVAVCHDFDGEYSHGMHMVYADLAAWALDEAVDPAVFPDSAEKYGVWEIPKIYFHLYKENPIVIDYDKPLSSFGGMTAFEVTQKLGYPCHESQQYTWFTKWIYGKNIKITKASQINSYSPCRFGLYRTTVGPDVNADDFMENITPYAEQERQREELLKLEQERLEEERLAEEQRRLEEAEKNTPDENREQNPEGEKLFLYIGLGAVLTAILIFAVILICKMKRRNK